MLSMDVYTHETYFTTRKRGFKATFPDVSCMEYSPTKLGHKNGVHVGIHIPAPWFAYGIDVF